MVGGEDDHPAHPLHPAVADRGPGRARHRHDRRNPVPADGLTVRRRGALCLCGAGAVGVRHRSEAALPGRHLRGAQAPHARADRGREDWTTPSPTRTSCTARAQGRRGARAARHDLPRAGPARRGRGRPQQALASLDDGPPRPTPPWAILYDVTLRPGAQAEPQHRRGRSRWPPRHRRLPQQPGLLAVPARQDPRGHRDFYQRAVRLDAHEPARAHEPRLRLRRLGRPLARAAREFEMGARPPRPRTTSASPTSSGAISRTPSSSTARRPSSIRSRLTRARTSCTPPRCWAARCRPPQHLPRPARPSSLLLQPPNRKTAHEVFRLRWSRRRLRPLRRERPPGRRLRARAPEQHARACLSRGLHGAGRQPEPQGEREVRERPGLAGGRHHRRQLPQGAGAEGRRQRRREPAPHGRPAARGQRFRRPPVLRARGPVVRRVRAGARGLRATRRRTARAHRRGAARGLVRPTG